MKASSRPLLFSCSCASLSVAKERCGESRSRSPRFDGRVVALATLPALAQRIQFATPVDQQSLPSTSASPGTTTAPPAPYGQPSPPSPYPPPLSPSLLTSPAPANPQPGVVPTPGLMPYSGPASAMPPPNGPCRFFTSPAWPPRRSPLLGRRPRRRPPGTPMPPNSAGHATAARPLSSVRPGNQHGHDAEVFAAHRSELRLVCRKRREQTGDQRRQPGAPRSLFPCSSTRRRRFWSRRVLRRIIGPGRFRLELRATQPAPANMPPQTFDAYLGCRLESEDHWTILAANWKAA